MAAQSDDSLVEVILFDRQLPLQIPRQPTCEALWRSVARKELGIKPSTLELFGIYFYIDLFFILIGVTSKFILCQLTINHQMKKGD